MYCSHCGKKVGDAMLFCPFCGEAIVVPEQDDEHEIKTRSDPEPTVAARVPDDVTEATAEAGANVDTAEATVEAGAGAEAAEGQVEAAHDDAEGDAAAELLDWDAARREVITDEWARRDETAEAFTPLELDEKSDGEAEDWRGEISRKKESAQPEKKPPQMRRGEEEPVRLEGAAPKLELETAGAKPPAGGRKPARKHANTLVPPKTLNPNDMFMADRTAAYDDAYDAYDDEGAPELDGTFAFDDDDDEGSFFMRHLRSLVGLGLFAILLLLFVIYAFSRSGQYTLARANLAWSTDAYSQLGYQSYQDEQYADAGLYYERALQRDPNNYSFASSAAMAYYQSGNIEKSAAMLKRCIEINPTLLEPYVYLLKLYPDAAQRPWDVTQLLQQGYQRTGDIRLNVTG